MVYQFTQYMNETAKVIRKAYENLVLAKTQFDSIDNFLNSEYETFKDVMDFDTYLKIMVLRSQYYLSHYKIGDKHVNVELFNMVYETDMSKEQFETLYGAFTRLA